MKKNILLVFLLSSVFTYSQNDCSDALIACGNSGYQDLNATGVGVQELIDSNTCGSEENNSLWFRININTGGKLGFILTPTFANGSTNTDLAKSVFVDPLAKVGVSIKPNLPPVFIFILNHKLLFSSLPHVFESINSCTPTPVAFKS